MAKTNIPTSLAPWLSVRGSLKAYDFYLSAFGAVETYRLDIPGEVIARLSINGAEFWLGEESPETANMIGETNRENSVRMILTVADPDTVFDRAVTAGATIVYPIEESHGWRVGRIVDPFGHHWEIGRPL